MYNIIMDDNKRYHLESHYCLKYNTCEIYWCNKINLFKTTSYNLISLLFSLNIK